MELNLKLTDGARCDIRRVVDLHDDVPATTTATVALFDLRDYAYPAGAVREPD